MFFHIVVVVGCPKLRYACIGLMSFRPFRAGQFALPFLDKVLLVLATPWAAEVGLVVDG